MDGTTKHDFGKELEELTMTPATWAALDKSLTSEEYRRVVNDYQRRERERLPFCGDHFGLCRYYSAGRCSRGEYCRKQK